MKFDHLSLRFFGSTLITARLASWALAILFVCAGTAGPASARASGAEGRAEQPPDGSSGPSSVYSMPRLGIEGLQVRDNAVMQAVAESGAALVRVQLQWSNIEPVNRDPVNYSWSSYDSLFSSLAANNLAPLVTVMGCPAWACVRDNGPLYDAAYPDFGEFMGALAARYSVAPYNVHYWEFWNEPDGAGGAAPALGCPANTLAWGCHPDKYVRMLSVAYPAIKAVDPASVVMNGGVAYDNWFHQGGPFNPDFLPDVLSLGGAQYLDAVAFHYYRNNAHGWTDIGMKVDAIRAVMSARGVDLPIICTETGLTSSTEFGSSEQIQARYVVQSTAHGASRGLHAQVWFLDRDYLAPFPGQEIFLHSGLLRIDNSRKPSHRAMQVLAQEIGSGEYLRRLTADDGLAPGLEGYRFRTSSPSRQVSVVWNNEPGQATLTVPASQAPTLLRAVSLYGQAVEVLPGPGGTRLVRVGADPLYVEWLVPRFIDVPLDDWAYSYIEYLAERGIVGGYADSTFRPGNPATRGQFSKMVVLGMGWPLLNPPQPSFRDVPFGSTFYQQIETAFSRGILGGYACGGQGEPCPGAYFRPNTDITRAQIAKLVVLAKGWPPLNPPTPTFIDVAPGSTFYTYIEAAAAHGIVGGYQDGSFRPGNSATRAQLSKMLALALQQP